MDELSTFVDSPTLVQHRGRRARLQRELAGAFSTFPWAEAMIERLTNELREEELTIESLERRSAPRSTASHST